MCAASVPPVFPVSTDGTGLLWESLPELGFVASGVPRSGNRGADPKDVPHSALERLTVPPSLRAHPLWHNLTVRGCTASSDSFKFSRYHEAVPTLERCMLTDVRRQASRGVFVWLTTTYNNINSSNKWHRIFVKTILPCCCESHPKEWLSISNNRNKFTTCLGLKWAIWTKMATWILMSWMMTNDFNGNH